MSVTGSGDHVFGRVRPTHDGDYQLNGTTVRVTTFRDLPAPTGPAPYRLDLRDIIPASAYEEVITANKLVFHFNGDIGGIDFAVPQQLVASGMEADCYVPDQPAPHFLYLVGDCVYFNGETSRYYAQFYQPYEHYPLPIFAVPGNHDGENLEGQTTLDGFVRNFCAAVPGIHRPEAGDAPRTAMTQPNVYWTLLTPLVNIIGLYSNVPDGGEIESPQTEWLVGELQSLPTDVPIIVTLHHPVYSADTYHSGSPTMKAALESAATAAGRHPDLVVAGHVHDYQRLTKITTDGSQIPYLVTGAGGYHNLHSIMKVNGQGLVTPVQFTDASGDVVTLESYVDDRFGFLRFEVDESSFSGRYFTVPRPQESFSKGSQLVDLFKYDWKEKRYMPNALGAG
jgi:3',5'-cyclic AMP phosphodiesterase CpdA